jgi:hypothetical protein
LLICASLANGLGYTICTSFLEPVLMLLYAALPKRLKDA